MNKVEAYNNFWQQFGVEAYDMFSVPVGAKRPYITYELMTDTFNNAITLTTSIWTRSTSWKSAYDILNRIEEQVLNGGVCVPYDNGSIWITSATPWCRRLTDNIDNMVKRLVLNLFVEFM